MCIYTHMYIYIYMRVYLFVPVQRHKQVVDVFRAVFPSTCICFDVYMHLGTPNFLKMLGWMFVSMLLLATTGLGKHLEHTHLYYIHIYDIYICTCIYYIYVHVYIYVYTHLLLYMYKCNLYLGYGRNILRTHPTRCLQAGKSWLPSCSGSSMTSRRLQ